MADTPANARWLALKGRLTGFTFPAPCRDFLWRHAVKVFTGWPILTHTVSSIAIATGGLVPLWDDIPGPVPLEPGFFNPFLPGLWPAA